MPQIQIGANRQRRGEIVPPGTPRARAPRLAGTARESVRFWEWDCLVKYPIIAIFQQNSSQYDTFQYDSCKFYTLAPDSRGLSRPPLCPILGMGLFRKIPRDSYISTKFITIQQNATHFWPISTASVTHTITQASARGLFVSRSLRHHSPKRQRGGALEFEPNHPVSDLGAGPTPSEIRHPLLCT
jgi:hypothetical protein